ncbi:Hint domain-containing protein [Rhodobacteraceae bacterium 2376]|uniref:Hint domain-containing protein n=1 Tax=Rhabdonatronobacter sediminivivens TaxID=2743469 RepID=A0A7Z0HZ43_9RHOB|nr:Hint domain-containing protein [Rhabdonatronobacter sediminivivens]NYS24692.1 Hint domain-containing protein [Rhabdonatronobacter sediminivivens]
MSVTINDAIVLSAGTPGVNTQAQGQAYAFDNGDFVEVLDGLVFEGNLEGESIGPGATVDINGMEFTLTNIYDFWAQGTTINLETQEEAPFQGQAIGLRLEDPDGAPLNLVVPADSLTDPEAGWTGDPINTLNVFSPPTEELFIYSYEQEDGSFANKLGNDNEVDIPCFTAGTLIDTPDGAVAVETLRPGDLVLTRDNGYLPLAWCGQRSVGAAELATNEAIAPVLIAAGALGGGLPERAMRVSPQHRMLVTGPRSELMFGEREVLVPALHMIGLPGITRDHSDVTYVHIMFERHEIVRADGTWSESFQPADWAMAGLDDKQREEVLQLFPELASSTGQRSFDSARMVLKAHEARALLSAA